MVKICLVGPVDKRVILYPLIKCITHLGKGLILADDNLLCKFADDFESVFSIGTVDFVVNNTIDDTLLNSLEIDVKNYDYVVHVTLNSIPDGCDRVIYCHGLDKSFCSMDVRKGLVDSSSKEVLLTFNKKVVPEEGVIKMSYSKEAIQYVWQCEEYKTFTPCKRELLISLLIKVLGDQLGVPKETIKGVLMKGGV